MSDASYVQAVALFYLRFGGRDFLRSAFPHSSIWPLLQAGLGAVGSSAMGVDHHGTAGGIRYFSLSFDG